MEVVVVVAVVLQPLMGVANPLLLTIDLGPVLVSVVVRAADLVDDDPTLGTSRGRRANRRDQHEVGPARRVRSSDRGTSPSVGVTAGACRAVGVRMGGGAAKEGVECEQSCTCRFSLLMSNHTTTTYNPI